MVGDVAMGVHRLKPNREVMEKWELKVAGMSEAECRAVIQRMREKDPVGPWSVNTRAVYGLLKNRIKWFRQKAGVRYYRLKAEEDQRAEERIAEIGEPLKELSPGVNQRRVQVGQVSWAGDLARRREWGREQRAAREARRHW
jgi:hypothetical protein